MADPAQTLSMWVVYDHPKDQGAAFFARRWSIGRQAEPTADVIEAPTLEAIREKLPIDLLCLPRHPDDDPAIVETWV